MNALEWRVALSLSAVYAVRMLGLFMILPVFGLYADTLSGSNALLAGIAVGIYGLTQASLQIPLGLASDRIGRKPVIIAGLLLFAFGSLVAALSDTIWGIILGRFLQGMGAVAAATMALAADLTREEHRARVMAFIGMTIGISFMVAMVLGPFLNSLYGLAGIFWTTFVLALAGAALVAFVVPNPIAVRSHRDAGILQSYLSQTLKNPALLRMDAGVFILHMMMTASFLVIPSLLQQQLGLAPAEHWRVYVPVFFLSFTLAIPLIIVAEKRRQIRKLFLVAITVLIVAELLLAESMHYTSLFLLAFLLFFIAFNFLEATQPSLVAKYAPIDMKGTAMGVYNSSQFLGVFVGGAVGGFILSHWQAMGVFWFNAVMAAVWLLVANGLPQPRFYASRVIRLPAGQTDWQQVYQTLMAIPGVREASIVAEEQVAYLKVDTHELDDNALRAFSGISA